MNYTNNIYFNIDTTHIIEFSIVGGINSIDVELSYPNFIQIEDKYCYSKDGVNFSILYTDSSYMINDINNYTDILYIRMFLTSTINDLYNNSTNIYQDKKTRLNTIFLNGITLTDYTITASNRSDVMDYDKTQNIFDSNLHLQKIRELQEVQTLTLIDSTGIDIIYFSVDPDLEESSYTFKQHNLLNVTNKNTVKCLFPLGEFKKLKQRYTEWGSEFEDDVKIDVSQTRIIEKIGRKPIPKDIIFMPFFDRLYVVNYVEGDTVERQNTFRYTLTLGNYYEDSNVNDNSELDNLYDYVDNFDVYENKDNNDIEDTDRRKDEFNNVTLNNNTKVPNTFNNNNMFERSILVKDRNGIESLKQYPNAFDIHSVIDSTDLYKNLTFNGALLIDNMYVLNISDVLSYKLFNTNNSISTFSYMFMYYKNISDDKKYGNIVNKVVDINSETFIQIEINKVIVNCTDANNNIQIITFNTPTLYQNQLYNYLIDYDRSIGKLSVSILDSNDINVYNETKLNIFSKNNVNQFKFYGKHNYSNIRIFSSNTKYTHNQLVTFKNMLPKDKIKYVYLFDNVESKFVNDNESSVSYE